MRHHVTFFKPCELEVGQKIRILGSKRSGDWEVIDIGEVKMTLRCPISKKELKCDRFCYFMEEKKNETWPKEDD